MKIYRCNCYDSSQGTLVSWHASKKDAEKRLRDFRVERGTDASGPESVQVCDIPTDKTGLIAWLNAHFDTDNG